MTVVPDVDVYTCDLCGREAHIPSCRALIKAPPGWIELLPGPTTAFKHLCDVCMQCAAAAVVAPPEGRG